MIFGSKINSVLKKEESLLHGKHFAPPRPLLSSDRKGEGQSAYHLPMILPFLAQRLFLIQISWNSKSVLSLGSYTWKNGQIRSAGRTVRQNRQFSGDRFFHVLDHLESIWKKKISAKIFAQKNLEKFRDLSQEHLSPLPGRNETIMSSR